MSFWSSLDPTNANSALGGYVKNTIGQIPGVGSALAGGLTAVGASNAKAAAEKRAQEAAFASSFAGFSVAGIPLAPIVILGGLVLALVLIFKRRS